MSTIKDGGPAFPVMAGGALHYGMTLRDKFADSAMQGIVVNHGRNGYDIDEPAAIALDAIQNGRRHDRRTGAEVMSTDRELLELAAKAYGLKWEIGVYGTPANPIFRWVNRDDGYAKFSDWNPLINDGDAFRLAVKLGLTADFAAVFDQFIGCEIGHHTLDITLCEIDDIDSDDETANARRAIVRAAAEIGKNL